MNAVRINAVEEDDGRAFENDSPAAAIPHDALVGFLASVYSQPRESQWPLQFPRHQVLAPRRT
jgi:hypothetical protein